MAGDPVRCFRDLVVWQVAMELTVIAYETSKALPALEKYELSAQIRRAAVSVPANIAEGQSCGSNRRFINHVRIAQGSLGELETHFEIARRLGFLTGNDLEHVEQLLRRTGQLLHGLKRSLRRKVAIRVDDP